MGLFLDNASNTGSLKLGTLSKKGRFWPLAVQNFISTSIHLYQGLPLGCVSPFILVKGPNVEQLTCPGS